MTTMTHTAHTPAVSPLKRWFGTHPLIAYYLLAFGLMWMFAVPLAFSRNQGSAVLPFDLPEPAAAALFLLATFSGPTIAAIIVTAVSDGWSGVRTLLKPMLQWRVRPRWYLVALTVNLLIWLLAYLAVIGPQLLGAVVIGWPLLFTTFLPLVAFGVIVPSIAEEPGWRGFALPRLQQCYGPVTGSLVQGALHGLWHLPVLFTAYFGPLPAENIVPFLLTAVFATFLYTWVFNRTNGSVLLAILLHAASNAASQWLHVLLETTNTPIPAAGVAGYLASTGWLNVIAYALVALVLVAATRGRLGYRPGTITTASSVSHS